MMRILKKLLPAVAVLCVVSCKSSSDAFVAPQTPDNAIQVLLDGNSRYVSQTKANPNCSLERITQTAPHQEPFAAVVGCSDSRVPVELLFDCGIGDIFVIRTAGNNVGNYNVMGSIEYAVDHLGVKVLMVLGHESCGGVTSAIQGGEHHGAVGDLLHHIAGDIPEYFGKMEELNNAIKAHTNIQVADIMANPIIAEKVDKGHLKVVAAHYDVDTGKVELL
jgi:carbonic anhydrase